MHIDEDFDDGIELTIFIGTIRRFNPNADIDSFQIKKDHRILQIQVGER